MGQTGQVPYEEMVKKDTNKMSNAEHGYILLTFDNDGQMQLSVATTIPPDTVVEALIDAAENIAELMGGNDNQIVN